MFNALHAHLSVWSAATAAPCRLDTWWRDSVHRNCLDLSVVTPAHLSGFDEIDMFRVLDPVTGNLVFWAAV
jgi:hypothetical protein